MEGEKTIIRERIEEAIDLIDKLERTVSRLHSGDKVTPGTLFQIYETLMTLREKIVEIRSLT
ncbi:hypothetical protein IMZ38_06385 [Thermosphaera chiliense]|uniref:Uncharacterized protein n=1 Tax=Thermosphaera chiliense TaxID=3402707 RepID=A0A7M1UT14_9CREN|nr:hypothetical protein [Thermosphaera aggregans]QOR94242.1 hypothetical protein IMZ38_06385 [Thermosphaera aggregans]